MPPKRPRHDDLGQPHGAAGGKEEALRDRLYDAVNAGVEEAYTKKLRKNASTLPRKTPAPLPRHKRRWPS
jgi:hypothetical protein